MAAVCCCTSLARGHVRHATKLVRFCDILNSGRPVISSLCQMLSRGMSLKVTESAEIMYMSCQRPSQNVGATLQSFNWQIWAFAGFFTAWVGRSLLQTVALVYSDDQAKVPWYGWYRFVFCSGE